jgi:hypothetical protein
VELRITGGPDANHSSLHGADHMPTLKMKKAAKMPTVRNAGLAQKPVIASAVCVVRA